MEVVLRKYGNSTVAVLPPAVLKDLGLSAGQTMSLDTTEQGQIVLSRKRRYVLADMIRLQPTVSKLSAQCVIECAFSVQNQERNVPFADRTLFENTRWRFSSALLLRVSSRLQVISVTQ